MITIRRAEPTDAAQIQQVYANAKAFAGTLQLPHPSVELWQDRLKQFGADDILLVALYDGVIVATAGLHVQKQARRRHVAMLGIGVADAYTGRGIGKALLTELLQMADNWLNLLRLELTVFCDNAGAIRLYQGFGFEIEGRHSAYALSDGAYADVFAMARLHPRPPRLSTREQ